MKERRGKMLYKDLLDNAMTEIRTKYELSDAKDIIRSVYRRCDRKRRQRTALSAVTGIAAVLAVFVVGIYAMFLMNEYGIVPLKEGGNAASSTASQNTDIPEIEVKSKGLPYLKWSDGTYTELEQMNIFPSVIECIYRKVEFDYAEAKHSLSQLPMTVIMTDGTELLPDIAEYSVKGDTVSVRYTLNIIIKTAEIADIRLGDTLVYSRTGEV